MLCSTVWTLIRPQLGTLAPRFHSVSGKDLAIRCDSTALGSEYQEADIVIKVPSIALQAYAKPEDIGTTMGMLFGKDLRILSLSPCP